MKTKIFAVLFLALCACDDTFEAITGYNHAPLVYFNSDKQSEVLEASVKTSLKGGTGKMTFALHAEDLEKQNIIISYEFISGDGKLLVNGLEAKGEIPLEGGSVSVTFSAVTPQDAVIAFHATDSFGASATITLKLHIFQNLPPVASFVWANKKIDGPYYVEFDASASKDQDADQGGQLQWYIFTIKAGSSQEIIRTQKPVVPYNLRGPGGYDVTLEVLDNDGATSAPFKPATQVTVN